MPEKKQLRTIQNEYKNSKNREHLTESVLSVQSFNITQFRNIDDYVAHFAYQSKLDITA